jgi:HAD superfamily hydrolase (TIGR01549 family)
MPTIRAVIFDLDQTLVDSSTLAGWRKAGMWTFVRANLAQVRPYSSSLRPAHELPAHFRAQGLKVGIVTSSPRWYAEALTKSFHIECDCLVTYEDTEQHKPDPAPLHEALRLLGVDAAEACYVGDDPIDVQASYHAHVVSVGAAWGGEKGRLASAAPDILAPRPDVLLADKPFSAGYFGELAFRGSKKVAGYYLGCGGIPEVYSLGRYYTRSDPRHAEAAYSQAILKFKDDDSDSNLFGQAVLAFLAACPWKPDYIVPIPPKVGVSHSRFESLLSYVAKNVTSPRVYLDGLESTKAVENYKSLGPSDREAAVNGAFRSKYRWGNGTVLLLDDVHTTGSTTESAARTLLGSGAGEVRVLALAKDQQVFERRTCEACGRTMRVRTNGRTGAKFWGCSGYPDHCQWTSSL